MAQRTRPMIRADSAFEVTLAGAGAYFLVRNIGSDAFAGFLYNSEQELAQKPVWQPASCAAIKERECDLFSG